MAEEKDSTFKITDRRRYNPDGSLRDSVSEAEPPKSEVVEEPPAEPADNEEPANANAANVVAFPGAANKAPETEEPTVEEPPPVAKKAAAAAANATASPKTAQSAQAAAVENAYHNVSGGTPTGKQSQALFFNLLNMLAVEAAMSLGLMEMEPGVRSPVDLDTARQIIDMLGMLKEKTMGNLASDEEALLEQVLADLRMQFVALSRRGS